METSKPNIESPCTPNELVRGHYDLGNDFFQFFLDPTMCYSCAFFEEGETFEQAQYRKIDYHIKESRAAGADRVLDIGCGWGALLRRLIEKNEVKKAIGITPSYNQDQWIRGFNLSNISIEVGSWYDHVPTSPYDAIISIEAFEHFARPGTSHEEKLKGYRHFFEKVHSWLKPGGYFSLQTMAYGNMRREDQSKFLLGEIFPEADLPTLGDVTNSLERLFEVIHLRNERLNHAKTNTHWINNLHRNWQRAVECYGLDQVRKWEKYLRIAAFGFQAGTGDLFAITLKRIDHPRN